MQHWKTQFSLKYQTKTNIVVQCFVGSERSQGPTSGHKSTRALTRHSQGHRSGSERSQRHTSGHTALTRAYERSHSTHKGTRAVTRHSLEKPPEFQWSRASIRKGTGLIRKGACRTESDCKRTASTNKSNVTTKLDCLVN
jgi:hypothetical protein